MNHYRSPFLGLPVAGVLKRGIPVFLAAALIISFTLCPGGLAAQEMEVVDITGTISEDTTWEGGRIYRLAGWVTVAEGAKLTIEPGAVLKFVQSVIGTITLNGRLIVKGELVARGTASERVYFTRGDDSCGNVGQAVDGEAGWDGILVQDSGSVLLENTEVRSAEEAAVLLQGANTSLEALSSTFGSNAMALDIDNGSAYIEGNTFQENREAVRVRGLIGGNAEIIDNQFHVSEQNDTAINLLATREDVKILQNSFTGSGGPASTVGIKIGAQVTPQNGTLEIKFNTFLEMGIGIKMEAGGHQVRGNNFYSSQQNGVRLETGDCQDLQADISYNYWGCPEGPRHIFNSSGSGDFIFHPQCLQYEPWGTRPYQPRYTPPAISIATPVDGSYVIETAELTASAEDVNLQELHFYIDGEKVCSFTEEVAGRQSYSFSWDPGAAGTEKSYLFTVKAVNMLGEEAQKSLTFHYLQEAPPPPALSFLSPPAGSCLSGAITVELHAAAAPELGENGLQSISLQLDGAAVAAAAPGTTALTWELDTAALADGNYTLTGVAVDAAGQESTDSITICADNTAPTTPQLLSPALENISAELPLTFTWGQSQSLSTPYYHWQLAAATNGRDDAELFASPLLEAAGLEESSHTIAAGLLEEGSDYAWRVRAVDEAGNEGQWSAARELRTAAAEPVEENGDGEEGEESEETEGTEGTDSPDEGSDEDPDEGGDTGHTEENDGAGESPPPAESSRRSSRRSAGPAPAPAAEAGTETDTEEQAAEPEQEEGPGQTPHTGTPSPLTFPDPESHNIAAIFHDMHPGHTAAEAVSFLYALEIVEGIGGGYFAPDMELTRSQAAMLGKRVLLAHGITSAAGPYPAGIEARGGPLYDAPAHDDPLYDAPATCATLAACDAPLYADLQDKAWYSSAVSFAVWAGILDGYEDDTFRPASAAGAAEFCLLLHRLEETISAEKGCPQKSGAEAPTQKEEPLPGMENIPPWALQAAGRLVHIGIIDEEASLFEPQRPFTRSEAIVLLYRFFQGYHKP